MELFTDSRRKICDHEAGHAAAVLLQGGKVFRISLPWETTAADSTNQKTGVFRSSFSDPAKEIKVFLGGYIADDLMHGDKYWPKSHLDWTRAEAAASKLGWTMDQGVNLTYELLEPHQELISRIGEALSQTTELSGDRIHKIYREYMENQSNKGNGASPINLKGTDPKQTLSSSLRARPSAQFVSRRGQIFAMGLGMLIFLLCFTVPAMWEHIGHLKPQYETMAKIGALSPEFAIFCFLLFHSWDRSMKVRKWSLIFGCVLAGLVIVHAAGLWGLKDGSINQSEAEDRLTEKLNEYGKQTAEVAENRRPAGQRITRTEVREQGKTDRERDKNAHNLISNFVAGRDKEIRSHSFLSEGYMNGPMYAVNFLAALLFTSILTWMHFSAKLDDIDDDGDGIADIHQGKVVNYNGEDYAKHPITGQADPQWADFLKWRDGIQAPAQSSNQIAEEWREGNYKLDPNFRPEAPPINIQSEPAIKPAPGKIPVITQSNGKKDPNV